MADRISIVKVFTCRQAKLFLKVFALNYSNLELFSQVFFISVAEPEASFFCVCHIASDLPDPVLN